MGELAEALGQRLERDHVMLLEIHSRLVASASQLSARGVEMQVRAIDIELDEIRNKIARCDNEEEWAALRAEKRQKKRLQQTLEASVTQHKCAYLRQITSIRSAHGVLYFCRIWPSLCAQCKRE